MDNRRVLTSRPADDRLSGNSKDESLDLDSTVRSTMPVYRCQLERKKCRKNENLRTRYVLVFFALFFTHKLAFNNLYRML